MPETMQQALEKNIMRDSWKPDRPDSRGATAFHEAVFNSTWIKDIIYELSRIIRPKIRKWDFVVDFGAGTGT